MYLYIMTISYYDNRFAALSVSFRRERWNGKQFFFILLYTDKIGFLILRLKCVYANESQWNRTTKYLFRNKWWTINSGHKHKSPRFFSSFARCVCVGVEVKCKPTPSTTNAENIIHSKGWNFFGFVYLCIQKIVTLPLFSLVFSSNIFSCLRDSGMHGLYLKLKKIEREKVFLFRFFLQIFIHIIKLVVFTCHWFFALILRLFFFLP